jgi:hypothetical protein
MENTEVLQLVLLHNQHCNCFAYWNTFQKRCLPGFLRYMRYSETMFYVAEAAMKGYNVGMTAEQAYNKAVEASVLENGLTQAAADAYLAAEC